MKSSRKIKKGQIEDFISDATQIELDILLQSQITNLSHNELEGLNTGNFIHLTAEEKSRLGILESTANKQNSLTHDGTGILYPTVDAVNKAITEITEVIEVAKDKHYIHNQVATSTIWIVVHNLKKHPAVTVVDSGNNIVVGDCEYNSNNQLTITFTASFSGKAYLN